MDDGLGAQLAERHQTFHVVVETDDAAKVFDADDEAVRHAAGTGVGVAEEQREGALHQSLLSGQVQLLTLRFYGQNLNQQTKLNTSRTALMQELFRGDVY